MGPLFFPPLQVNLKELDFDLKKVKRLYFQFYFGVKYEKYTFKLRGYAMGKKRRREESYPPFELAIAKELSEGGEDKFMFPKLSDELVLGQLELSNVQLKRLLKKSSGIFIFIPREQEINPYCLVYDVSDQQNLGRSIETANPCPPARPPADDAGNT